MKKLLFVISAPPYSSKRGTAQLEAAMVAAAFDAEVSLIFRGDGIWSLLPEQNAQQVGQRSFAKVLQALGDYEGKYGTKINDIKSTNNLSSDTIFIDQKLIIP